MKKKVTKKTELVKAEKISLPAAIESAIAQGDLSKLDAIQRVEYYRHLCLSIGVNPLTKPFDYIVLNSKLTLYANKNCAEQLRRIQRISVVEINHKIESDLAVVTVRLQAADGRIDGAIGAVPIGGAKHEALANVLMKAETKAKRRATLSLCSLGMLDETEIETIPNAVKVVAEIKAPEEKVIQPPAAQPIAEGIAEKFRSYNFEKPEIDIFKKAGLLTQTLIVTEREKHGSTADMLAAIAKRGAI